MTLMDHLLEIKHIADERADINWEGTGPNAWMKVLTEVGAAIDKCRAIAEGLKVQS